LHNGRDGSGKAGRRSWPCPRRAIRGRVRTAADSFHDGTTGRVLARFRARPRAGPMGAHAPAAGRLSALRPFRLQVAQLSRRTVLPRTLPLLRGVRPRRRQHVLQQDDSRSPPTPSG